MTADGYYALESLLRVGKPIKVIVTLSSDKAVSVSDYVDFSPLAEKFCVSLKYVTNINKEADYLRSVNPSLIIVNGWSQLLSAEILTIPKYGCIGTHPALLPKNRGRAPIAWHFLNEERFGGVTLFYLSNYCDDGPIVDQVKFAIGASDNARSYYDKITDIGAKLLLKNYDKITSGTTRSKQQDHRKATYLLKRRPKDSFLDFSQTVRQIHNKVRAVSGVYPSAFFHYQGNEYRVKRSEMWKTPKYSGIPGQIAKVNKDDILVLAGDTAVTLAEIEDSNNSPVVCSKVFCIGYVINE